MICSSVFEAAATALESTTQFDPATAPRKNGLAVVW
jgi:hypothetical protein